jgi:hypothetical protein
MELSSTPANAQFHTAVSRVCAAIRKLATAASGHFGSDCYLHMQLGQVLLADLGFESQQVVGFAAWRVGEGDGDVIAHVPYTPSHLTVGADGYPYHAWLSHHLLVVDLTTYQLNHKAQQLDAVDGGRTSVTWCPQYLLLPPSQINTYKQVSASLSPGVAYYERRSELAAVLRPKFPLDPDAVEMARRLLANPDLRVIGPNSRYQLHHLYSSAEAR